MNLMLHPSNFAWLNDVGINRWNHLSKRSRQLLLALGIVLLLLFVLRLFLPFIVKSYVNRQLTRIPEYRGTVGDIDIHLWRGAYRIQNLRIEKMNGNVPVPFFYAPMMDLSMQWSELFHGAFVGEVLFEHPQINFVDGSTRDQQQAGIDRRWSQVLESLFPFRFNHFDIHQGEIHFRNFQSDPPVDIYIHHVDANAVNLHNSRDDKSRYPASLLAHGRALGDGELKVEMQINPLAKDPTFKLKTSLTRVNLVTLNDFLRAYGKFDVERGTLDLFVEVESNQGHYEGYVKPLLENIDVFSWQKEKRKNILEIFWQAIVGTVATIFKNQPKDRLATTIPIKGDFENHDVDLWSTVGGILRNAFVRALLPKFETEDSSDANSK